MKGAATAALILQSIRIGPCGLDSMGASARNSLRVRAVAVSKPNPAAIGAKSMSENTAAATGMLRIFR